MIWTIPKARNQPQFFPMPVTSAINETAARFCALAVMIESPVKGAVHTPIDNCPRLVSMDELVSMVGTPEKPGQIGNGARSIARAAIWQATVPVAHATWTRSYVLRHTKNRRLTIVDQGVNAHL